MTRWARYGHDRFYVETPPALAVVRPEASTQPAPFARSGSPTILAVVR